MTARLPILVVDDSDADRYLLRRELQEASLDAEVFEAADGQDAYEFLAAHEENKGKLGDAFPPAVVFLDVNMPRMNGFAFLESFSKLQAEKDGYESVAIIMLSSSEFDSERERAMAFDCVRDFVVKGQTTPDELRAAVERAVRPGRPRQHV